MCLNLYKVHESLLKVYHIQKGSLILHRLMHYLLPSSIFQEITVSAKTSVILIVYKDCGLLLSVLVEITVSALSSGIACVKHTLPLVYREITASAINLGDTNVYEETYLLCH